MPMITVGKHKNVFEYDGAYICHDCDESWGALPDYPKQPAECVIHEKDNYPPLTLDKATEIAAQCWCTETTSHIEMDTQLAEVFANVLLRIDAEARKG